MNVALRLVAGAIDLLQFIFFITLLALQFMTPVGGGIAGAVAGAGICWNLSGGVMEGISNALTCATGGGLLGAGLSALATPIGIGIDIAISCTFGILLILMLWVTGRFSFMAVAIGFGSEMMPGINAFVPGWSLLVHRCIVQYNKKQREEEASSARTATNLFAGGLAMVQLGGRGAPAARRMPAISGAIAASPAPERTSNGVPLQTRNFDGIRPTAGTRPNSYAKTA